MNCHKDREKTHSHSSMQHILHMAICCGLPIVILGFLPVITAYSPAAGNAIGKIVPFLCPIMMISMMAIMAGGNKKKNCCGDANEIQDKKSLEPDKNRE